MALSTMSSNTAVDQEIWQSLQQAISKSSGFKNWQKENKLNATIEEQVKQYLRSTLETLAY
jgi:hypothetical protein